MRGTSKVCRWIRWIWFGKSRVNDKLFCTCCFQDAQSFCVHLPSDIWRYTGIGERGPPLKGKLRCFRCTRPNWLLRFSKTSVILVNQKSPRVQEACTFILTRSRLTNLTILYHLGNLRQQNTSKSGWTRRSSQIHFCSFPNFPSLWRFGLTLRWICQCTNFLWSQLIWTANTVFHGFNSSTQTSEIRRISLPNDLIHACLDDFNRCLACSAPEHVDPTTSRRTLRSLLPQNIQQIAVSLLCQFIDSV